MKLTAGQKRFALYVAAATVVFFGVRAFIGYLEMRSEAATTAFYRDALDKSEKARKEIDKKAGEDQAKATSDMAARDKRIKILEDTAVDLGGQSNAKGAELADLKEKYKLLTDCPSQRDNLLVQNKKWESRFGLAQNELITERKKTAEWIGKATDWRVMYEAEKTKTTSCNASLGNALGEVVGLEATVKSLKFKVIVRDAAVVAVVGAAAYLLLVKK